MPQHVHDNNSPSLYHTATHTQPWYHHAKHPKRSRNTFTNTTAGKPTHTAHKSPWHNTQNDFRPLPQISTPPLTIKHTMDNLAALLLRTIREVASEDLRNRLNEHFHHYARLTTNTITNVRNQFNYNANGHHRPQAPHEPDQHQANNHDDNEQQPPPPQPPLRIGMAQDNAPPRIIYRERIRIEPRIVYQNHTEYRDRIVEVEVERIVEVRPTFAIGPPLHAPTTASTFDDVRLPRSEKWQSMALDRVGQHIKQFTKFPHSEPDGNPYPVLNTINPDGHQRELQQPEKAMALAIYLTGAPHTVYDQFLRHRCSDTT